MAFQQESSTMRTAVLLISVVASATGGFGQCIAPVASDRPEWSQFQQIGSEADEAARLALIQKFIGQYPDRAASVYEQMQISYLKTGNPDKAIETGEKILALVPACPESAHQSLKAAEAKKDPDLVKSWSARAAEVCAKVIASPKPASESEVATWENRVDWARQATTYTEYSLYAMALQVNDPAKKIDLMETLLKRNPDSEYMIKGAGTLFLAYEQTGQSAKALEFGEKALAKDQSNPDILLVVAGDYLSKNKEPDKVHAYTARVVELCNTKPEGISDADWQKRRRVLAGTAQYMNGTLYYTQSRWADADRELREALPQLDNQALKAEALFYLGFSNYKMDKGQEAYNYYRQCAAIPGRFRDQATKNMSQMKSEYTGLK
jgi:tetratricopeptide (TPR) repeat protein